ncbi:DUF1697 domain-containing protein [Microbacterium chocolatum]|uniref:DUF1697 domain-containing protein n=1 Tax=Microbacterium aurantiacum TaxID=162393 RepID=UPI00338DAF9E
MAGAVALLRGINVGGRNLIRMPELQAAFRDAGYLDVRTYIQSGNVLFATDAVAGAALEDGVERVLEERFGNAILAVVRSRDELAAIVDAAPAGHGDPDLRSDVLFLKDPAAVPDLLAAIPELDPEVDRVSPGPGVLYFSRVAARASSSRLTRIIGMPIYTRLTIRNWNTTTRVLALLDGA